MSDSQIAKLLFISLIGILFISAWRIIRYVVKKPYSIATRKERDSILIGQNIDMGRKKKKQS